MLKTEFYRLLAESLELKNVELEESTNLKEIQGYDSMSILVIIAFVDDHFSVRLSAKQLNGIDTVRSLMELIGPEHFS